MVRGKSHSAGQEARSSCAAGWDGSGDIEARLVVLAAGHRTSPSGAARSGRMPVIVARPVLVPEATFQQKGLPLGGRVVDQAGVVVASRASGFAVAPVNVGIPSADIGPAAVSEEHVNARRHNDQILSLLSDGPRNRSVKCRGQIESSASGQVESSAFRPRPKAKPAIPSSQDCVPAWRPGSVKTAPGLRAEGQS